MKACTNRFEEQAVHYKEQNPLQTVEDGEQVGHGYLAFSKLETTKDPCDAQYTQLCHRSDSEGSAESNDKPVICIRSTEMEVMSSKGNKRRMHKLTWSCVSCLSQGLNLRTSVPASTR